MGTRTRRRSGGCYARPPLSQLLAIVGAVLVGTILGLLGAGGSIMTVPIMLYLLGISPKAAMSMSLVVVGATSAAAAVLHARDGTVRGRTALPFALAGIPGALAGARLARLLPETALLVAFAAFMTAAAVALLRRREDQAEHAVARPPWWKIAVYGVAIGLITGLLGAGGGFLIVPALTLLTGLSMRDAVGTSLVVITVNAAAGFAARADAGLVDVRLTALFTAIAIAGAVAGHWLNKRMPVAVLRRVFAVLVLAVAAYMVGSTVWGLVRR